ncbi:MAG: HDIG domain-containing protein [Firmicutes bacterium]|nr:HDIG domain-containing protein [Bacillota bacterium]
MKRLKRPKIGNRLFYSLLVFFVFAASAVCVAFGAYSQDGYSLRVGQVSLQKIKAPRDIEDKNATDRNRQAAEKAASDIMPLLKKDQSVADTVLRSVNNYFSQVGALRAAYQAELQAQAQARADAQKLALESAQAAAEAERLAREAAGNAAQAAGPAPEQSPDHTLDLSPVQAINQGIDQAAGQSIGQVRKQAEAQGPEAGQGAGQAAAQSSNQAAIPTPGTASPGVSGEALPGASMNIPVSNAQPTASPAQPSPSPSGPTAAERLAQLQVPLTAEQCQILLASDQNGFNRIESGVIGTLLNLWDQGFQEVDVKVILSAQDLISRTEMDSNERAVAYEIAVKFLEPNLVEDSEATDRARSERAAQYTVVTLLKGQTIVDEGSIISQDEYDILDSLGLVSGGLINKILPVLGAVGVVALCLLFMMIYITNFNKNLLKNKKEAGLLFTLYIMTIAIVLAMTRIETPYQIMPVMLFAMLSSMLLDLRLGAVLSVAVTLVSMLIFKGGPEFFMFYATAGFSVSMLAMGANQRGRIFYVGLQASGLCFALMFMITIFFEKAYSASVLTASGYAALNGLFTVILCVGSLPFWEALFGVATNIRFLDLTNPANPLMHRMILEAPGTYHHSLIVANLAETAAIDIGADPGLARAGAYYHDIGKLRNPQYFSENIAGGNPHDFLPPLESAEIIASHVTYGIEMANRHRLPDAIKSIISQHHGTTVIKFFYFKEKMGNPDADVSDTAFRYQFVKPQFREAGIVMLADTAEAAVRSMVNSADDADSVGELIDRLIKDKQDDGQLIDSGFTLKDIDTVGKAFLRVFKGMYHERIRYPGVGEDAGERAAGGAGLTDEPV